MPITHDTMLLEYLKKNTTIKNFIIMIIISSYSTNTMTQAQELLLFLQNQINQLAIAWYLNRGSNFFVKISSSV